VTGVKLAAKGANGTITFDVQAKLDERERKSQQVTLGFNLLLSTKPALVRFEIAGTAVLAGKDADVSKMMEVDPETKVPFVFQRIYQSAFTVMYLLSSVMSTPPPPQDLLVPPKQGVPADDVSVQVGAESKPADGVTIQADTAAVK